MKNWKTHECSTESLLYNMAFQFEIEKFSKNLKPFIQVVFFFNSNMSLSTYIVHKQNPLTHSKLRSLSEQLISPLLEKSLKYTGQWMLNIIYNDILKFDVI